MSTTRTCWHRGALRGLSALVLLVAWFTSLPGQTAGSWNGQEPLAPGVTHLWKIDPAGPWVIHVLEVDLRSQSVQIKTAKAHNRVSGRELTSILAKKHSGPGHRVVGAINGDFFSADGVPVGAQVIQGALLKNPSYRSVFGLTEDRSPFISRVRLVAFAITSRGDTLHIQRVNGTRYQDELVLYNRFRGSATGTNQWGAEVTAHLVDSMRVGIPFRAVVTAVDSLHGNSAIPGQSVVLSGHGLSRNLLLRKVIVGDTLQLELRLPPLRRSVREAVGGLPRIVRDGKISIETDVEGGENFKNVRHPRTAVGFSEDSSTVYLVTVDGRQPGWSVGMTLPELAHFMLDLGAYQAMNLDGGGSTTMVVRDSVVNRPSDATGERPVANAILVVTSARPDTVSALQLSPDSLSLPVVASYTFRLRAWDRYKVPLDVDTLHLVWTCDPAIGHIDPNGRFYANDQPSSGWIRVRCRTLRDSAFVRVSPLDSLWMEPPGVELAIGEQCHFQLTALYERTRRWIYRSQSADWSLSGTMAKLTAPGVVEGLSTGKALLRAGLLRWSATADVFVDTSATVVLDRFDRIQGLWSFGGKNLRLWECGAWVTSENALSPPRAVSLRISFVRTGATPYAALTRHLPIWGHPDLISLGLLSSHRVVPEVWLSDRDNQQFRLRLSPNEGDSTWTPCSGRFENLLPGWQNPGAQPHRPLRLTELRFYYPGGTYNEHVIDTLRVDDLALIYGPSTAVHASVQSVPQNFRLSPAYPNPFQSAVTASLFLARPGGVRVRVYDIRGRLVWSQDRHYRTPGPHRIRWAGRTNTGLSVPSGVYLMKVSSGKENRVIKIARLR